MSSILPFLPAIVPVTQNGALLARKKNAGMFICTKPMLPGMIERKYGKIVNLYLVSLSIRTSAILAYTGWLQVYLK